MGGMLYVYCSECGECLGSGFDGDDAAEIAVEALAQAVEDEGCEACGSRAEPDVFSEDF